ncbi:protein DETOXIFICATION 39-like [Salvia splendens]|uniref:protein DETOXIFICATION 39-like n=1 Tax=Salvia splendens TaxID=180675 RepID=UPI001C257129|nr:protein DETOXIFICATION 39-like [Salvia splendens]
MVSSVLSGAARGCGRQTLCAVVNLGAYYVVAIPCAALLCLPSSFTSGAWGFELGSYADFLFKLSRTNWNDEVLKAAKLS